MVWSVNPGDLLSLTVVWVLNIWVKSLYKVIDDIRNV